MPNATAPPLIDKAFKKVVSLPAWVIGASGPLVGALLALAVTWGVLQAQIGEFQKHMENKAMHTNTELVEYRLTEIQRQLAQIQRELAAERDRDREAARGSGS